MKRSINSTGRQRITHNMVSFRINRSASGLPLSFDADLNGLSELALPPSARVSVEPFFGHSSMRFEFGTIGALVTPTSTLLDEIDIGGEVSFRVKVIDDNPGHLGRLLASGDRFSEGPLSGPEQGLLPLLPVKPEWLEERIWDVSTSDGNRPYLLINSRIPGLAARIQSDPLLRGSILVEAFRKVLSAMVDSHEGEGLAWFADWKKFLNDVLGVPYPEDLDPEEGDTSEQQEFIQEALKAFSNKFRFATHSFPIEHHPESTHD